MEAYAHGDAAETGANPARECPLGRKQRPVLGQIGRVRPRSRRFNSHCSYERFQLTVRASENRDFGMLAVEYRNLTATWSSGVQALTHNPVSSSEDEVLRFIAASFPSVWALELLLALKSERRPWTRTELVGTLRASDLVVSKAVDALVAAGLASIDADQLTYIPITESVGEFVERAEALYRTRPDAVRRVIISAGTSSAAAFADAFRFRRPQ